MSLPIGLMFCTSYCFQSRPLVPFRDPHILLWATWKQIRRQGCNARAKHGRPSGPGYSILKKKKESPETPASEKKAERTSRKKQNIYLDLPLCVLFSALILGKITADYLL